MEEQKEKVNLTSRQAADLLHVNRTAILEAINRKRLSATKIKRRWFFREEDIMEYQRTKFSREKYFNIPEGNLSLSHVAKLLGKHQESISKLLRTGKMKGQKIGNYWMIRKESVLEYISECSHQKKKKEEKTLPLPF